MKNKQKNTGFTLVELLVVVLIIAILAAVALPQYKKSVRKARLAEVGATFNTLSKGIDMWLLENKHYPRPEEGSIFFSGNNGRALDVDQSCVTKDDNYCYTKIGRWGYGCNSNHCEINLTTSFQPDGTATGNNWLNAAQIRWFKTGNGSWGLSGSTSSLASRPEEQKEICLWWRDLFGADRMLNEDDVFDNACSAYF